MIGDAQLPQNQSSSRITFATFEPFKRDSALLPSGLLGRVRLLLAEPEAAR